MRAAALPIDSTATGTLHAHKVATVAAEVPGRVLKRSVERGGSVKQRDPLFRLDTRKSGLQLAQARANEAATEIDLGHAERELGRGAALLAGHDISRSRYDQLEHGRDAAAKRRDLAGINRKVAARTVSDGRVRAPFDGTVVRVHAEVGDYVAPGSPLATVADLSKLRFRVGLTATEAAALDETMQEVELDFPALGGLAVTARLHDVSSLIDPASGTYTAEFWLDQPQGEPLREGMVGRIRVVAAGEPTQLVIPRQAVTRSKDGFAVWVVDERDGARGVARHVPVTLGHHDATDTVVRSGLEIGDTVVVRGQFSLADGIAVELDEDEA